MKMRVVIILGILVFLFCSCAGEKEESATGDLANSEFTVNLNGFNIFYAVYGQGPVLMAMPNSWGLSHQGLRSLYRPLEEHLTMVIAGAHDLMPPTRVENLYKSLPNSTFVVFENSGHFSQVEEIEKFKKSYSNS